MTLVAHLRHCAGPNAKDCAGWYTVVRTFWGANTAVAWRRYSLVPGRGKLTLSAASPVHASACCNRRGPTRHSWFRWPPMQQELMKKDGGATLHHQVYITGRLVHKQGPTVKAHICGSLLSVDSLSPVLYLLNTMMVSASAPPKEMKWIAPNRQQISF